MADYIPILEIETDPEAPSKASLWKRWASNWIAGFEGALGAPRLRLKAVERLNAGDEVRSQITKDSGVNPIPSAIYEFAFMQVGTIRATIVRNSGAGVVQIVRERNGVTTVLAGPVSTDLTVDISVIPGDEISLQGGGDATNSYNYTCAFKTSGESLWPSTKVRLEGNDVS